ncbi:response regulator transcription factor [Streptomyces sp. ODS28]|uniref:response regulator transcription factor n=1 Tax=Streptomyces sp. ODS28 TaxID=3136688 RepID=UPI0031E8845C
MIRVAVVDDEELVRTSLRSVLGTARDMQLVADCGGEAAVRTVQSAAPDVVLLDIRMPDVDGLTVLRQLRARDTPPVVAMLTTFGIDEYLAGALRAGAAGFLLKDTEPEQFLQAVRSLAAGGSVLDPRMTRTVIGGYLEKESGGSEAAEVVRGLTPREREVLGLLGQGLANPQIAMRLGVRASTVKGHVEALLGKLGGLNRVQAGILADRAGLVPDVTGGRRG